MDRAPGTRDNRGARVNPYERPHERHLGPARGVTTFVLASGMAAGLLVVVFTSMARTLGLADINLPAAYAGLFGLFGSDAWMIGMVLHLFVSALIARVYFAGFRAVGDANASIGAAFGVVHWIAAGIFLGLSSYVAPLWPLALRTPGWFALETGFFGFFLFFVLHVMFGAIVGEASARSIRRQTRAVDYNPA